MNTSTNSLGNQVAQANVQHGLVSRRRLNITVTATNDVNNLPIFAGYRGLGAFTAKGIADAAGQNVDAVMTIEGFATIADFAKYMEQSRFAINGARIHSTDAANFDSEFKHTEKYPYGVEDKVGYESIEDYKVALPGQSGGWSQDLRIPADKLVWRPWYGLIIELTKIKAGTTMKFSFDVVGVDKSFNASPIASNVIQ